MRSSWSSGRLTAALTADLVKIEGVKKRERDDENKQKRKHIKKWHSDCNKE